MRDVQSWGLVRTVDVLLINHVQIQHKNLLSFIVIQCHYCKLKNAKDVARYNRTF